MRRAAVLVFVSGLAFLPAAHADQQAGAAHLTIKLSGVANPSVTAAAGTFTASGAFTDSGKFTVRRNPSTLHDLWHLSGKHGTITASSYEGKWTIVSGTRSYAGLHGNGTSTETTTYTGFRQTWTGTLTG